MRSTKAGVRVYLEVYAIALAVVVVGGTSGRLFRRKERMYSVVWRDFAGDRVVKISVRWWVGGRVSRKCVRKRQQRESPRPLVIFSKGIYRMRRR